MIKKHNRRRKVIMVNEIIDKVVKLSDPIEMFGESLREIYRFNKLKTTVPALEKASREFVRRAYAEIGEHVETKWKSTSERVSIHLGGGAYSNKTKDTTMLNRIESSYFFLSCAMLNFLNKKDITYDFLRQSLSDKNLANPNFIGSHYTGWQDRNINFVLSFLAAGFEGKIYAKKVVPALRKLKRDRRRMQFIDKNGLEEDIERLNEYVSTGKMGDREEYLINASRHIVIPLLKKGYGSGDMLKPFTYQGEKTQCTEKGDYVIRKNGFNPRYVVPLAKRVLEDSKFGVNGGSEPSRLFSNL